MENKTLRNEERLRTNEPALERFSDFAANFQENESAESKCPVCGAVNDPGSLFCEHCGSRLRHMTCPKCGAPMDEQADYCEQCHQYVDAEHCSFCHAQIGPDDVFCPECGASLSGIECPVCHTVGRFGFCEACGSPLTDSARKLYKETWRDTELAEKVTQLTEELEKLWMTMPVTSEQQVEKRKKVRELEQRVKSLIAQELAKKDGAPEPSSLAEDSQPQANDSYLTEEDLKAKIEATQHELQQMLDSMATAAQPNSAYARNVAMARKPRVSRLAWRCNYKQALHGSPMGCACPQHGGTWVVLGSRMTTELD